MQSTPMYLALHVLPPVVVVLLALFLLRLVRRLAPRSWLVVLWLSIAQFVLYIVVFVTWFRLAESDRAPWLLGVALRILSMPLTYLSEVTSLFGLARWLGADRMIFIF